VNSDARALLERQIHVFARLAFRHRQPFGLPVNVDHLAQPRSINRRQLARDKRIKSLAGQFRRDVQA
jgi:hypothetical protein